MQRTLLACGIECNNVNWRPSSYSRKSFAATTTRLLCCCDGHQLMMLLSPALLSDDDACTCGDMRRDRDKSIASLF
jgi:hypothetical protein